MSTIAHLPTSNQQLQSYKTTQSKDPICQQISNIVKQNGHADRNLLDPPLRENVYNSRVDDSRELNPMSMNS